MKEEEILPVKPVQSQKFGKWFTNNVSVFGTWLLVCIPICFALSCLFYRIATTNDTNSVNAAATLGSCVFSFFTLIAVLYTIIYEIPKNRNNKIFEQRCACAARILEAIDEIILAIETIRTPTSFISSHSKFFGECKKVCVTSPNGGRLGRYLHGRSWIWIRNLNHQKACHSI